jgi:hypothetical protein
MALPLTVGQSATRSMTLTAEHVRVYSELTGRPQPAAQRRGLHGGTRFKDLIVQGGLTTGLLHALVAMDLPGPGTVFLEQHWRFPSRLHRRHDHRRGRGARGAPAEARRPAGHPRHPPDRRDVLDGEAWTYTASPE